MGRADQYRTRAHEAERRAQQATSEEERRGWWRIAAGWRDLQAQAELDEKRRGE
jgi:hypothetical protein